MKTERENACESGKILCSAPVMAHRGDFVAPIGDNSPTTKSSSLNPTQIRCPAANSSQRSLRRILESEVVTSPRGAEIGTTDGKAIPRMKTEKYFFIRGISIVVGLSAEFEFWSRRLQLRVRSKGSLK